MSSFFVTNIIIVVVVAAVVVFCAKVQNLETRDNGLIKLVIAKDGSVGS